MKSTIKVIVIGAAFAVAATGVSAEDGKALYDKSCASCHGKDGAGQTTIGKKLGLKDYTDAKVQESLKDEELVKAIKDGVKEGEKVKMKGYGDKLKDEEIKAIVAHIRSFKK